MCKCLYNSILLVFFILSQLLLNAQSISQFKDSKLLDEIDLIEESIFYPIEINKPYVETDLIELVSVEQKRLIQTLHVADLTTSEEIKHFDKFLIDQPSVRLLYDRYLNYVRLSGISDHSTESRSHTIERGDLSFEIGYELFREKDLKGALDAFDRCNDIDSPYYDYAQYYSGLIRILNRDFERAYSNLGKIGSSYQLQDHLPYYLALCHFAMERYEEVIKWYEPRLREPELYNKSKLKELVALSHYKMNHFEKSIDLLDSSSQPDLLISALLKSNNYQEILQYFGNQNFSKFSVYTQSVIAEALHHDKQYEQSIDRYASIISNDNRAQVNYNIAQNYISLNDYEKAISHLSRVKSDALAYKASNLIVSLIIDNDQLSADMLDYNLISQLSALQKELLLNKVLHEGQLALSNRNVNLSERYLSLIAKISLSSIQEKSLLADIGWFYFTDGDYVNGKKTLVEVTNSRNFNALQDNDKLRTHYAIGYMSLNKEDMKRALGSFSAAQLLSETEGVASTLKEDILNRIGDCYYALEEYNRSQKVFQKAYNHRVNQGDHALFRLGSIRKLKSNSYEQIMIYEELIESYPNSKYSNYCNLEIGNRYFELGQYDNAKHFYQSIEYADDLAISNMAQLQLGLIYVNVGDYDTSEKYYQQVLRNDYAPEYVSSAQKSLKELYVSYKIDADSYAHLCMSNDKGKSEESLKLEFTIEQYNNENYAVALKELASLKSLVVTTADREKVNYYTVLSLMATNHEDFIKEAILFCDNYNHKIYSDVTDHLSQLLIIQGEYDSYISLYEKGWFNTRADRDINLFQSLVKVNQLNVALSLLEQKPTLINAISNDVLASVISDFAKKKKWNSIATLHNVSAESKIWITVPKIIYIYALSVFNLDEINKSKEHITQNYDRLIVEASWFAKTTILLSDCYYLEGQKTMAIAVLEAMIGSNMTLPPTLLNLAKAQLSELNL